MPNASEVGGAAGGIAGLATGPVGSAIGSALGGLLGGLFSGGGTPMGSTEFDGLHDPSMPKLEASSMKAPEAGIFKEYATGLGLPVEKVLLILQQDMQQNGHDMKYVIDAWRNTNLNNARKYIQAYNQQHPYAPITEGSLYTQAVSYGGITGVGAVNANSVVNSPAPAATQQSLTLPTVNVQTGGTNAPPEVAPNYMLYGGIAFAFLILILVLKR